MVARGHVQNGVIVLEEGVDLPEGQAVTVVTPALEQHCGPYVVSKERQEARSSSSAS